MYTRTVDTVELQSARIRLSGAMIRLAAQTVAETGIRYAAQPEAPGTYADLMAAYDRAQHTKVLPVWNGASRQSLYLSAHTNWAFRYWHDMGHVRQHLTFSILDETDLQYYFHAPTIDRIVGMGSLASQLYWADTVGQLKYLEAQGDFPRNQLAFDVAYVEHGDDALSMVF